MEKQRNDLIHRINKDKQQLAQLEDTILKLLFDSEGNILDNEGLVDGINETKELLITINGRLSESKESEEGIEILREKYRLLALRMATLFFCVQLLSRINGIYQFSLDYFIKIVCDVVSFDHPNMQLDDRIIHINNNLANTLYAKVVRGLFDNDKTVLQFVMALAIEEGMDAIDGINLQLILNNDVEEDENVDYFSEYCLHLEENNNELCGLSEEIFQISKLSIGNKTFALKSDEHCHKTIKNWNNLLSNLQKMCILKVLKPDIFLSATIAYASIHIQNPFSTQTKNDVLLSWWVHN